MPKRDWELEKIRRKPLLCECGNHAWTRLTRGYVVLVSPEDIHFLIDRAWSTREPNPGRFYVGAKINGVGRYLHRLIVRGKQLDHVNANGLDNRRPNIRKCTTTQNHANQRRVNKATGFKGVSVYGDGFKATITKNRKTTNLGVFGTAEAAARAYDKAAEKVFGVFARPNFP